MVSVESHDVCADPCRLLDVRTTQKIHSGPRETVDSTV